MDDSLFDPGGIARLDRMGAEAINWAEALIKLSAKLQAGGFTSKQAYDLTKLWFGEQLCHQLTAAASGE